MPSVDVHFKKFQLFYKNSDNKIVILALVYLVL
jgi:hypothetical protein